MKTEQEIQRSRRASAAQMMRFISELTQWSWMDSAACANADPEMFFPVPGDEAMNRKARAFCDHCPVREECLQFSLDTREMYGIWGGLSDRDRKRLMRPGRMHGAALRKHRDRLERDRETVA